MEMYHNDVIWCTALFLWGASSHFTATLGSQARIGLRAPGFLGFDSYMKRNTVGFETKENWSYV